MSKKSLIVFIFLISAGIVGLTSQANAANCGETAGVGGSRVACSCGDTATTDVILQATDPIVTNTCTGHGLIIGADGITIDGNNQTITGDRGPTDYGINNSDGYDNITIENFSSINNFGHGIVLTDSTGSTIQNNTVSSNHAFSITLNSGSGIIVSGNTIELHHTGIWVMGSNSITINNNTISSGTDYGIRIASSNSTVISNNTISLNTDYGIRLSSSSDSTTISNNTISSSNYCIHISSSDSNIVSGNTISLGGAYSIYLSSSTSNQFIGNTISSGTYGIYFSNSTSNSISNNILLQNSKDFNSNSDNTWQNNTFSHNLDSAMLDFSTASRVKNLDDSVSFTLDMKNIDGTNCDSCSYSVATSPSETFTPTKTDNQITGTFTATQSGIYNLIVSATDDNNNTVKRNYAFYIGADGSKTTRYYYRGINPTHGQPASPFGNDGKSLLFTAPVSTETGSCSAFVECVPDELPDFPLAANVSQIDISSWYKIVGVEPYFGLQKFGTYSATVEDNVSIASAEKYTWVDVNLTNLTFPMENAYSWYFAALKIVGTSPYWITFPAQEADADPASWAAHCPGGVCHPSYADFTYNYTTTPAIKSISNEYINVLSATAPADDSDNTTLVLENPTSTVASTNIVLDDYSRPFLGYTTTINSDGTATLQADDIIDVVTINSVNMEVIPDAGLVDIYIATWNTEDDYLKVWVEIASAGYITAEHIVRDLAPNNYYHVTKDGVLVGMFLSNDAGEITFAAPAGSIFAVSDVFHAGGGNAGANHCFIATAAYGIPIAEEVMILRQFRNEYLLTNPIGRVFVDTYYKISPSIAGFIRRHPVLKKMMRENLKPLIWISRKID